MLPSLKIIKIHSFHHDWVRTLVCFRSPINKAVTGSDDNRMIVWDTKTFSKVAEIGKHFSTVFHSTKWNDNTFLSCSNEIISFKILPSHPFFIHIKTYKQVESNPSGILRLLKLDEDRYVFINFSNRVAIMSYSENKIIRVLENETVWWTSHFAKSLVFDSCFFLNTADSKKTIKLINYEKNEEEMQFSCHSHTESSRSEEIEMLLSYKNERNEEILVCGGGSGIVFFMSTVSTSVDVDGVTRGKIIRKLPHGKEITGGTIFETKNFRYICAGDCDGAFLIFDISGDNLDNYPNSSILSEGVATTDLMAFGLICSTKSSMRVVASANDKSVSFFDVENIEFDVSEGDLEKEDSRERIEYLCENIEHVFLDETRRKKNTFSVFWVGGNIISYTFLFS